MEIRFTKPYLRDLYLTAKSDKKHPYQPAIIRKYIDIINLMTKESNVLGLTKYNSLNYEHLIGDKKGTSSVRVNKQYRIQFKEEIVEGEPIATICNITDLSNHYK